MRAKIEDVCERESSNLKLSDVVDKSGDYPIYGAAGYIGNIDFYHQENAYVAVVKDGAGIGRTLLCPARSSVIGTLQYLLPKDNVLPEYLCYVIRYMHLEKYFTGATIPHIYFKDYKNVEFNLASLEKQKEVVNILGKCEKVIASYSEELGKYDNLIKARFVEMFGDILCNDKGWPIYTLDTISSSRLGKMLDAKRNTGKNLFPYLANFNVQWFKVDLSELHEMDFVDADREEFSLKDGDLLITEGGEVGRCAIWHNEVPDCYFQKALHRVRCDKNIILPEYLAWWFKFHSDFNGFEDIVGGKATIAHLPGVKLKKLQIEVPDIKAQKDFASFWRKIDKSKLAVQKALDETQLLFDSLMQQYFG